jgi:hypothetical protein
MSFFEFSDACATTTDHDTSFCGVDGDGDEVCAAFDLDFRDRWAARKSLFDQFTDLDIFRKPLGKIFFASEPT